MVTEYSSLRWQKYPIKWMVIAKYVCMQLHAKQVKKKPKGNKNSQQ